MMSSILSRTLKIQDISLPVMIVVGRAKVSMVKLSVVEQGPSQKLGVIYGQTQSRSEYARLVPVAGMGPVCALFDQLSARAFSAARAKNAERFLARSSIRRSRRSVRVMFTRTVRSAASGRVTRKATASLFSGSAMITSSELGEGNSSPSSTIPLT